MKSNSLPASLASNQLWVFRGKIYPLLLSSMFCDAITRLLWLLKLTAQTWTGNSEICLSLSSSVFLVVFVCSRFFKAMQWVDSSNVHGGLKGGFVVTFGHLLMAAYLTAIPLSLVCPPGCKYKAMINLISNSTVRLPFSPLHILDFI